MTTPQRNSAKLTQPSHGELALFATTLTTAATTRAPIRIARSRFALMPASGIGEADAFAPR